MSLPIHPIANEFPEFEREDYAALKADIAANGQLIPIELYHGQILDGRNRYKACTELGLEPHMRSYDGPDPLGHAISLNVIRRQLSTLAKAELALLIKPRLAVAAAERVQATQPKPGEGARLRAGKGLTASAPVRGPSNQDVTPNLLDEPTGKAADQAAKAVGVSGRTVENVAYLKKHAPELIPDIRDGLLTISQGVDKTRNQEAIKRQQEVKAHQSAARAARTPDSSNSEEVVVEEQEDTESAKAKAWDDINKILDVVYNLRLITPAEVARVIPDNAQARVRRILEDTTRWCSDTIKALDSEDLI
jgi:hypothetical protein